MRLIDSQILAEDQNGSRIYEYDENEGMLIQVERIKSTATPLESGIKDAWADEDYETVYIFTPFSDLPPMFRPTLQHLTKTNEELEEMINEQNVVISEQDEAIAFLYEYVGSFI